jgi:GNAT superfamily N-acetyltransferase
MTAAPEITVRKVDLQDPEWKPRFEAFYAGRQVKRLRAKPHAYFAAFAGGELAGHSVVYFDKGRWIMDGLLVKPEFREMGVAKRLTEARIRHAIEQGAPEIWYACDDGNLVTICCHLRFGFQKVCPDKHRCTAATAHWYRLPVTPELKEKFLK